MLDVAFRVDAGPAIGTGHLTRCLTLAGALAGRAARARFLCRDLPPDLRALVTGQGHQLVDLAPGEDDAEQTRRALDDRAWSWIVVDHYALGSEWESAIAGHGRVLAIDDLANRRHACDLLLDQNLVAGAATRYAGLTSGTAGQLLGPRFALLAPVYADLHDRVPPREGPVERVLISFGGFDPDRLTERALAALTEIKPRETHVDVVIADPARRAAIETRYRDENVHPHAYLQTLAPLMARADLAIGASGSTTWERLCLGLPSVIVTFADNQTPIAEELQRRGLARWLGASAAVDEIVFGDALAPIFRHGLDPSWSKACAATVDGRGAARVGAAMDASSETLLQARTVRLDDEALLLEWANDPVTRRNGFAPVPISAETHRAWFRRRLGEADACRFFVVETTDGLPLGQVRFQRDDSRWELHYAVAPAFRSRGLGRPMLAAALDAFRGTCPDARVFGQVQPANQASVRIFEKLGFERQPSAGSHGAVVYERIV